MRSAQPEQRGRVSLLQAAARSHEIRDWAWLRPGTVETVRAGRHPANGPACSAASRRIQSRARPRNPRPLVKLPVLRAETA